MSKLINCKDCGNQISKNAKSCPNCGAKNKRTSIITWLALIFLGIPFLMGIFGSISDNSSADEEETGSASLLTSTADDTSEPLPDEVITNWDYSKSEDAMRGTVTSFAQSKSLDAIQLDFPYQGGTNLYLMLRNSPESGNELMISTDNGQLWCEYSNCYMSVKFDNDAIKTYPLAKAAAGTSDLMFLDGSVDQFINKLKKSENVMIEIGFFNYGNQQFRFDTGGLEWSY
ncbi:hypothetical protein [Psychrobacter sp. 16-MNA-CIBAN-0192]|uniref:hypothetical protein n=1 Tax=Psychrobacter sp. 16-MNA-CIBAN-0192 TaxID=3140448 RepID=UPI0033259475